MPGVLLIEAMAQATGLLAMESAEVPKEAIYYLVGVDKARFKRPVMPGDQLVFEVEVLKHRREIWVLQPRPKWMAARSPLPRSCVLHGISERDRPTRSSIRLRKSTRRIHRAVHDRRCRGEDSQRNHGRTSCSDSRSVQHQARQSYLPVCLRGRGPAGQNTRVSRLRDRRSQHHPRVHHRASGTVQDQSCTCIGNDNLLMAYTHVAHDCRIGNQVILANAASLGGHVHIGDWAILGGFSIVHQFCRIGQHCFTGMGRDQQGHPAVRHGRRSSGAATASTVRGCTGAASPLSRSPQSSGPTRRSIPQSCRWRLRASR